MRRKSTNVCRVADDLSTNLAEAARVLASATDVTLLAHVHPDADALGSALAVGLALHRRGVRARVSFGEPAAVPESLLFLDVAGLLVPPRDVPAVPVCTGRDGHRQPRQARAAGRTGGRDHRRGR